VRSCNFLCAGLSGVTLTAKRTAGSAGKNRASCSAHPCSSAMSVISRFCPDATDLQTRRVLASWRARAHPPRTGTQCPEEGKARRPPKFGKGFQLWNLQKCRDLPFSAPRDPAQSSQPETLSSHSSLRVSLSSLRRTTASLRARRLPFRPALASRAARCCSA